MKKLPVNIIISQVYIDKVFFCQYKHFACWKYILHVDIIKSFVDIITFISYAAPRNYDVWF